MTTNRYQPPAQHRAWAARAALCVATDDKAALHLLLDQVTAHETGINELVWALASECASLFEATDGVESLARYAETWQARANAEAGNGQSGKD